MYMVLRRTKREYWTSELRVATGRSAIRHLLSVLSRPVVYMPSYVPEGVIGPCKDIGSQVVFYKLNPDLTPDIDDLRSMLPATPHAMVIVIHYFGYPALTHELCDLVTDAGGVLFEDCAHTLYSDASKAKDADVALWSLNKFMPVVDGAILRSRCGHIDVNSYIPLQHPGASSSTALAYRRHLDLNAEAFEVKCFGIEKACLLTRSETAYEEYYRYINSDYTLHQQSAESQLIESQFDVEQEERTRNSNAWRMSLILPGLRGDHLPQFAFPLMCKSSAHRDVVTAKLLNLGILPSTLVDKWDHVPRDGNFTAELDFMDRHLLLPLGDPMDQELIGQISGAL